VNSATTRRAAARRYELPKIDGVGISIGGVKNMFFTSKANTGDGKN
jgi:hypothetical protein